jgi:hypothetical protein
MSAWTGTTSNLHCALLLSVVREEFKCRFLYRFLIIACNVQMHGTSSPFLWQMPARSMKSLRDPTREVEMTKAKTPTWSWRLTRVGRSTTRPCSAKSALLNAPHHELAAGSPYRCLSIRKCSLSSGSACGHTNSHGRGMDAYHHSKIPYPSNPGTTLKTALNSAQRSNHRHCVSTFTRHDVNVAVRDWKCTCFASQLTSLG